MIPKAELAAELETLGRGPQSRRRERQWCGLGRRGSRSTVGRDQLASLEQDRGVEVKTQGFRGGGRAPHDSRLRGRARGQGRRAFGGTSRRGGPEDLGGGGQGSLRPSGSPLRGASMEAGRLDLLGEPWGAGTGTLLQGPVWAQSGAVLRARAREAADAGSRAPLKRGD